MLDTNIMPHPNTLNANLVNSSQRRAWLIVEQELKVSFASKRGLFVSAVFIFIWTLLLFYPIRLAAEAMQNPDTSSLVLSLLTLVGLEPLKTWILAEFAIYWAVALFLLPAFSILMSTDQMISDRNRGSLKFLTLRCTRGEIFFGRFMGQLLIQLSLLVLTLFITFLISLINNSEHWLSSLQVLPLMFINLLVVICPFIALMSLFSVLMTSVPIALIVALLSLFLGGVLINLAAYYLPIIGVLNYAIPGIQLVDMAQASPDVALLSLWVPIMQCLCYLALGFAIFKGQEI